MGGDSSSPVKYPQPFLSGGGIDGSAPISLWNQGGSISPVIEGGKGETAPITVWHQGGLIDPVIDGAGAQTAPISIYNVIGLQPVDEG